MTSQPIHWLVHFSKGRTNIWCPPQCPPHTMWLMGINGRGTAGRRGTNVAKACSSGLPGASAVSAAQPGGASGAAQHPAKVCWGQRSPQAWDPAQCAHDQQWHSASGLKCFGIAPHLTFVGEGPSSDATLFGEDLFSVFAVRKTRNIGQRSEHNLNG